MHQKFSIRFISVGWKNSVLVHNNALPVSRLVRDFLSSKSLKVVRQALYSSNFSFEDFWLYLKLKALQNNHNFKNSEDLKDFLFRALNFRTPEWEIQIYKPKTKHVWPFSYFSKYLGLYFLKISGVTFLKSCFPFLKNKLSKLIEHTKYFIILC